MSLLIVGANLINGVTETAVEDQSIWIENGRIKKIGRLKELNPGRSVNTLNLQGKFVIPGLMDANVHLMGDIRMEHLVHYQGRYEELITESAQVALKAGLTTVFDTWGPRKPLTAIRDKVNAGAICGSRIFCAGNIVGLDGPFSADFIPKVVEVASSTLIRRINSLWAENVGPDLTWMTPEQVVDEVQAYIHTGIDFIKYASNEHRGWEPNSFLLFSPRVQRGIVEQAHLSGITAQAHTSSVEGLRIAIEAGCDLIQHCNITGPVPIPVSTLDLIAKKKLGAVVFPFTERRLQIIKERAEPIMRRYFSTVEMNCLNLIQSGAMLLLATDGGIQAREAMFDPALKNNWMASGEDNLAELGQGHFHWLKAMEEKGLSSIEGLRAATKNIAVAYGKDADFGTLEPGKIADMLVLDRDPLQAAENYRSIHMIIKEGVIVDREKLPTKTILTGQSFPPVDEGESYGRYSPSRYPSCC